MAAPITELRLDNVSGGFLGVRARLRRTANCPATDQDRGLRSLRGLSRQWQPFFPIALYDAATG